MNYKKERLKRGWTQLYVAKKTKISLVAWQLIERGITQIPRKETQKRIDDLFGEKI